MATAIDPAVTNQDFLTNKEFHNWIKAALALLFVKEGLTEFVLNETTDLHKIVLLSVFQQKGISPGTTCNSCTTANLLLCPTQSFCNKGRRCREHDMSKLDKMPKQICPNGICNALKEAICNAHTFGEPSWKNTDARRWCSDAYEVAKCFMPPDGYSDKKSFAATDFNGMVSVIINNKRFQAKMTAQLNTEPNVCSRARDVGRMVRHSASIMLSDVELARCIDALRDLLQDAKYLQHDKNAQDALKKLDELKNNTLVVNAGDVINAIGNKIRESVEEEKQMALLAIQAYFCKVKTESISTIEDAIVSMKLTVLGEIQQKADKEKQEINRLGHHNLSKLDEHPDEQLLNDLIEDLIKYYTDNESMIPASPLVEQYAVPLEDLYVQPLLSAFNSSSGFGRYNTAFDKTSFMSYKDLLFSKDNRPYRKIYITAGAGMGKTSLSQHITMRWCQAKTGKHTILRHVEEELGAMRRYEFVFLIRLREYQDSSLCYIDDMIYDMVSKKISRCFQYSKEFLQKTMHNRECLIILDELDEWTHPEICPRTPGVPHNNHSDSCTVLTTTRSWKLSTIELPSNHIDRNVEISELVLPISNELKMKAFKLYHAKANKEDVQNIDISNFDKEVAKVEIGDIISIPYILLQIFCIWLDGLSIGKSKWEVYSNITEMTIKRGLKKKGLQAISLLPIEHLAIPKCLDKNVLCKRHLSLLLKLAELAFFTLFSVLKESKLLIDSEKVLTFLSEPEIDFCLKVGLLNKTTDTRLVSNIRYKVFFQHKSLHEFYAAVHIAFRGENQILKQTIGSVCTSVTSILEMTDVFVFVCGMNPQVYAGVFLDLQNVVDNDTVTCKYRSDCDPFREERTMLSFQSMQLSCFRESLRNQNINCAISLQDIFVCKDTTDDIMLAVIHNFNLSSTKSVSVKIENRDNELCFLYLASHSSMYSSLETLRLAELSGRSAEARIALPPFLLQQAHTLKCLELFNVIIDLDITIVSIVSLTALQALYFEHVTMNHTAIEMFFSFLRNHKIMRQLKMCSFFCGDHNFRCNCSALNLSQLNKLEKLYLHHVHVENYE